MGEPEATAFAFLIPGNSAVVVDWRSDGNAVASIFDLESDTLTLNVLWAYAFVATLSTTLCTNSISSVALHADFAMKHACYSLRESCHGLATNFLYLTATTGTETT